MAIQLSNTFTQLLLEHTGTSVADQIGGGSIVAYSGTPPDGPNEALGQHATNTVLFTFTISASTSSSFAGGSISGGVMNLTLAAQTVAATATGTATFFRILGSGGGALIQGSIGTSGADWNLTNTSITTSENVTISGTPSIAFPVA